MGYDVTAIYVGEGTYHVAWINCHVPEIVIPNAADYLREEFMNMKSTNVFEKWEDIEIRPGHELIAAIFEDGRYIGIWTGSTHVFVSNMGKNARRRWKKRLIEVLERSKNHD